MTTGLSWTTSTIPLRPNPILNKYPNGVYILGRGPQAEVFHFQPGQTTVITPEGRYVTIFANKKNGGATLVRHCDPTLVRPKAKNATLVRQPSMRTNVDFNVGRTNVDRTDVDADKRRCSETSGRTFVCRTKLAPPKKTSASLWPSKKKVNDESITSPLLWETGPTCNLVNWNCNPFVNVPSLYIIILFCDSFKNKLWTIDLESRYWRDVTNFL